MKINSHLLKCSYVYNFLIIYLYKICISIDEKKAIHFHHQFVEKNLPLNYGLYVLCAVNLYVNGQVNFLKLQFLTYFQLFYSNRSPDLNYGIMQLVVFLFVNLSIICFSFLCISKGNKIFRIIKEEGTSFRKMYDLCLNFLLILKLLKD